MPTIQELRAAASNTEHPLLVHYQWMRERVTRASDRTANIRCVIGENMRVDTPSHVHRRNKGLGEVVRDAFVSGNFTPLIGENVSERLADRLRGTGLFLCSDCSCLAHQDDAITANDEPVGSCCSSNYGWSEEGDEYVHTDDQVRVYHSHRRHFMVSGDYARDRYRWNENDDQWQTDDYYSECTGDEDSDEDSDDDSRERSYCTKNPFSPADSPINCYHSSKRFIRALPSPVYDVKQRPLRVGIELEVETSGGRREAARAVKRLFNGDDGEEHYCLCEADGSLTDDGFEIVTAYTGLDTHERILSRMNTPGFTHLIESYGMRSHDAKSCGLHVTIDAADISRLHLAKLTVFLNDERNRALVEAVCRRYAQGYCKIKKTLTKVGKVEATHTDADRYEILNATKLSDGVLEFRGPKGTLKFESIMAAMEFIRMAWLFTETASAGALPSAAFVDYVWRPAHAVETKYLRPMLVAKKIAPKESRDTAGRLTLTESYADALEMGFISVSLDI